MASQPIPTAEALGDPAKPVVFELDDVIAVPGHHTNNAAQAYVDSVQASTWTITAVAHRWATFDRHAAHCDTDPDDPCRCGDYPDGSTVDGNELHIHTHETEQAESVPVTVAAFAYA